MIYERLVEGFGHETIAELVGANLGQDLTAQGMGLVNALWDNRDQIQVELPGFPSVTIIDVRRGRNRGPPYD